MTRTGFLLSLLVFFSLVSMAQSPTVHATGLKFSNVFCNELRIAWSSGNGDARIVLASEASAVDTFPTDFQSYNANPLYGGGTKLRKSYSVYSGTGSFVNITGLKKGTTYYFAVYEFNNNAGQYEYLTGGGFASGNVTTGGITADFDINDRFQCFDGNYFTFTNKSSNTVGGGMTYKWNLGENPSSFKTTKDITHTYVKGGIFKVKLTVTTTGCETDTIIRDTVVVPYNVDFGLDTMISKDTIVCYGNIQFNLKNQSVVPNPPIYGAWDRSRSTWTTSQGHKGTAFNFDFQTDVPGKITVRLVMARQVQKNGEYCLDSIERVLEVRPPPLDSADINFSDSILCLATNEFTFNHSSPDIVKTTWWYGDGAWSNDNPAVHKYSSQGRFEVLLEVEDFNGCVGEYADTIEIVATPNNFFSGLSGTYCIGDPMVNLKPNLSGGQFKGNLVNGIDSTFDPNTVGTYTIEYVYTIGNCKDTFSVVTQVLDRPQFSIGADTIICANTDVTLQVDVAGLNYNWDDQSTNQTRTVNQPGVYWVKADDGQCSFSDTAEIVRVTLPKLNLGNDTSICGGEVLEFDIFADAGTITWSDGNQDGFKRNLTESGFYKATINHPCGVVSDSILIEILPTACDIFIPNAFSPNSDQLNEMFYPLGLFKFTSMMIFNEYGMNLFESYEAGVGWDGKVLGTVCPPGTYYFLIRYQLPENGVYTKKVATGPIYLMW